MHNNSLDFFVSSANFLDMADFVYKFFIGLYMSKFLFKVKKHYCIICILALLLMWRVLKTLDSSDYFEYRSHKISEAQSMYQKIIELHNKSQNQTWIKTKDYTVISHKHDYCVIHFLSLTGISVFKKNFTFLPSQSLL